MDADFCIVAYRNSENLHLRLLGDFEQSAANNLVESIRAMGRGVHTIFVHTGDLRRVDPRAHHVLRSALHRLDNYFFGNLIFTGNEASLIAPENSVVL